MFMSLLEKKMKEVVKYLFKEVIRFTARSCDFELSVQVVLVVDVASLSINSEILALYEGISYY